MGNVCTTILIPSFISTATRNMCASLIQNTLNCSMLKQNTKTLVWVCLMSTNATLGISNLASLSPPKNNARSTFHNYPISQRTITSSLFKPSTISTEICSSSKAVTEVCCTPMLTLSPMTTTFSIIPSLWSYTVNISRAVMCSSTTHWLSTLTCSFTPIKKANANTCFSIKSLQKR